MRCKLLCERGRTIDLLRERGSVYGFVLAIERELRRIAEARFDGGILERNRYCFLTQVEIEN